MLAIALTDRLSGEVRRDERRAPFEVTFHQELSHGSALPFRQVSTTGSEVVDHQDPSVDRSLNDLFSTDPASLRSDLSHPEKPLLGRPH